MRYLLIAIVAIAGCSNDTPNEEATPVAIATVAPAKDSPPAWFDKWCKAIRSRESSDYTDRRVGAAGEQGGYQIMYAYYLDSVEQMRREGITRVPTYDDVSRWDARGRDASERVVWYYMRRYGVDGAWSCAARHNGGPRGAAKRAAQKYADDIVERMGS